MWNIPAINDNETFYGSVFSTGDISLRGQASDLSIKVDAITERHTDIKLPLFNNLISHA